MEGVPALRDLMEPNDDIAKIDLKDAYVVVPLHQQSRKYLTFQRSWDNLPIQDTGLWDVSQLESAFKNDAFCGRNTQETKYSVSLLFRRHMLANKIKRRNEKSQHSSNVSSGETWIYHQQRQEQLNSITETRIFGFPGSFLTGFCEYRQCKTRLRRGQTRYRQCQRRDNSSNTGRTADVSGRSIATYPTNTERLGNQLSPSFSPMESEVLHIEGKQVGTFMVDRQYRPEEWPTNHETEFKTSTNHTCRCVRYCTGSHLKRASNHGILDYRGKRAIHQRKRTQSNFIRTTATRTKIQKSSSKDIYRQHNGTKICNQIRRHIITNSSRLGSSNTRYLQQIQPDRGLSTYTREREHRRRSTEQTSTETTLRDDHSEKDVQEISTALGTDDNRRRRLQNKSSTTNILELQTRSGSSSRGRIPTNMDKKRLYLFPPWKLIPQVIQKIKAQKLQQSTLITPL